MGAGASVASGDAAPDPSPVVEPRKLNRNQKEWLVDRIRAKYETGIAPEKVLEYAKGLPNPPPKYVSQGESELLSLSIFHRHGSRGPGASELRAWSEDKENGIVSQWQEKEIENLTSTGHILLKSLGKFFSERYFMRADDEDNERVLPMDEPDEEFRDAKLSRDVFSKNNVGRAIWRCSRSNRVLESGQDFNRALCETYNHSAQPLPVKDILPRQPTRYEDVEDENRADDHGVDHYFRPWNVFKKEMSATKNGIVSNMEWVEKANNNLEFLTDLFTRLGVDASVLACGPKMLWCTTYLVCLSECERFWPSYKESLQDEPGSAPVPSAADEGGEEGGGGDGFAASQAETRKRQRNNLMKVLDSMEEEYSGDSKLRMRLRPPEEFPVDEGSKDKAKDAAKDAAATNAAASSTTPSQMKVEGNKGADGVEEEEYEGEDDEHPVLSRIHALALWCWEERFIRSPYATELGGRIAFDVLQTSINHLSSGLNLFSGHDYTILGILSVLKLFPGGKIPRSVGFGAYLVFEVWSDTPPLHASHFRDKQDLAWEQARKSGEQKDGDDSATEEKKRNEDATTAAAAASSRQQQQRQQGGLDDPEDRRVLRILYNDRPFEPQDEAHVVEYMEAYADSISLVQRYQYQKRWPVMEDQERVLAEWDMKKVARVMGDLYQACRARNMKISLSGSPGEDYRSLV